MAFGEDSHCLVANLSNLGKIYHMLNRLEEA